MEHPIQGLMDTAMKSIKEMVDVNTIVGNAVKTEDGKVIIPVSKVSFGFASGGGEYSEQKDSDEFPFAGGSVAGVSINPVAFLVAGSGKIKLLSADSNSSLDKIIDLVPEILEKVEEKIQKKNVTLKNKYEDEEIELKRP